MKPLAYLRNLPRDTIIKISVDNAILVFTRTNNGYDH